MTGLPCEPCRLNLSEGCFYTPLATQSPAVNACAVAPGHGLFAAAGEEGLLECFDLRQRRSVGVLDTAAAAGAVRVSPADHILTQSTCLQDLQ